MTAASGKEPIISGETAERFSAVAHSYEAVNARYLIILTPRLASLIAELQQTKDRAAHAAVYRKYQSELLEV